MVTMCDRGFLRSVLEDEDVVCVAGGSIVLLFGVRVLGDVVLTLLLILMRCFIV